MMRQIFVLLFAFTVFYLPGAVWAGTGESFPALQGGNDGSEAADNSVIVVACTEEGKICPDGTIVSREGPDCEFTPCPESADGDAGTAPPLPEKIIIPSFLPADMVPGRGTETSPGPDSEQEQR